MSTQFSPVSSVVDAPNRRGVKRYVLRTDDGVTKLQIETPGFLGKYDLRGWQPNDLVECLTDFGIVGYVITGTDADGNLLLDLNYYFSNSAGLLDAADILMNPVIVTGPIDGATTVQSAISLLNTSLKNLITSSSAGAVAASIAASAPLTAQIWAGIVSRHFSFDGTTLKIDYDADGDVNS